MSDLPSGTVTLLFTDVEGSTRLLLRGGDDAARALAEHRRLLKSAFADAGGFEVDTQGESFLIAFADAGAAAAAATAAQRALAAHRWPSGSEVRVRMGIHTGTPALAEHGYAGFDVHKGARICAVAHGGQVVLSKAARESLDDAVELLDLGAHRLKDLEQPEQLFQLAEDGLPVEFPPLRSLSSTNLPVPPNPLVGREQELAEVSALVRTDGVRIVTLTGAGGSGKTRLALEAAAAHVGEFRDGVYFIGLASVAEPERLAAAIAQPLGVREVAGVSLWETLAAEIRDRETLLVLDNFEQLVSASPFVATLVARAPRVKLLVTSRERLHVLAEREYPVPSLPLSDAVALFAERARAVKPDFDPDAAGQELVAAICRRLDGLPLAVELAAARVRALPLPEILARLEQRLAFLTGGARDLPVRQQCLRAAIEWSHELLGEAEQTLFARLSAFVDGFELAAAEAVCSGSDVLGVLTSLCDKNLIALQDGLDARPRFAMLETIREYASERLDVRGEAADIRARHGAHFVALAEEGEAHLTDAEQATWLRVLEGDHENLRAALGWAADSSDAERLARLAGALWRFWLVHGHLGDGRRWIEAALDASGPAPTLERAKLLLGASALALTQGDSDRALALAEERLEICRSLGDSRATASALVALANVVSDAREHARAAELYAEAGALAAGVGDVRAMAGVSTNLAYLALGRRDWDGAAELAAEAVRLSTEISDTGGIALALLNLGLAEIHQARWHEAAATLDRSLGLYADLGYKDGISYCLEGLGAVVAFLGDDVHAAELLGAAAALRSEIDASLEPHERDLHDRTVAALTVQLSAAELDAARRRGSELSLASAVELGLAFAGRVVTEPASGGAAQPAPS